MILSWEGLACCCLSLCALVCHKEYWGAGGFNCGAVSTSGRAICLFGIGGGISGCDGDTGCHCVDWPGLGGLIGGWASLTRSSPKLLDSLSNEDIVWSLTGTNVGCANEDSLTGNCISLNFPSWEILKHWWAASQNWYPLDPGLYLTKIISWLFGSCLCLCFFRMCTQTQHLKSLMCEISGFSPDQSSFSVL